MDLVIYRKAHFMMQPKKSTYLKFTIIVESLADTEAARLTTYNTTHRWNTQVSPTSYRVSICELQARI